MLKKIVKGIFGNDGDRKLSSFIIRHSSLFLIALVTAIIAACWWPIRMRFPFDDTYITFRYAENLAHGFGLVWNAGTVLHPAGAHTEGYTNFLLVLLLTPFVWIGCDLVIVSQIIGVVAVIISAVAMYQIISNTVLGTRYAVLTLALFLLNPFTWMNAYSGLETSLFTMWLVVALWAFTTKRTELAFMLATFAALTRPEGALLGMILLVVALIQKRQHPSEEIAATLKDHPPVSVFSYWLSAFVLPLALYAGWKFWYFGNLLPNSFYVKVGQVTGSFFLPGRGSMRIFYTGVWYLLPFGLIAVWKGRKNPAVQITALWCWLLSCFYLFSQLIQNEYQRFTYPIEVFLILLAAMSVSSLKEEAVPASATGSRRMRKLAFVALVLTVGVQAFWTLTMRQGLGYLRRTDEAKSTYPHLAEVFRSIPDYKDITLAWGDAGRLPYYSGIRSIDPVGLNTNEIAHAHTAAEVVEYVMKAKPDLIVIPLVFPRDIPREWNRSPSLGWMVLPHGQGLIGSAYPALARAALASTYKPIVMTPQPVYELDILVDTTSVFYTDIVKTFDARIGHDPDFLPPAMNIQ